jgi:ATP-dependent DNA helicase RecG
MTSPRAAGHLLAWLAEAEVQALAETLVSLANSDGGVIVIGFDEQGRATAALSAEDIEGLLRRAVQQTSPPVGAVLEPTGKNVGPRLLVRVPRGVDLHSLTDGRVLVRVGRQNRALTGEEIRTLAMSRQTGDFEMESVAGAALSDFDDALVAEYVARREARTRRQTGIVEPTAQNSAALLREIGALDMQGRPTVAGLLLFCRNPQAFLPQSSVVFVKFPGVEPRGEQGRVGYGRREEIGGPLARVIQRTWQVVFEEMRVGAIVKGLEREEVLEYPEFAVREALVNAVCHRDYRLRGRRIEVRKYADRLEILSPGGLAGYMTLDNIIEEHFSRNPRIVQGLFQWGYIEELGLGIDRMIEDMVAAGHPAPRFHATAYSFSVTLSNARERRSVPQTTLYPVPQPTVSAQPAARSVYLNERQTLAVAYMREHGRITSRDYQALCPDVSAETLRTDLSALVEQGVLLRVGEKRGTYYILK